MACINKSDKRFVALEKRYGDSIAEAITRTISRQKGLEEEFHIPTIREAKKFLKDSKTNTLQKVLKGLKANPYLTEQGIRDYLQGVITKKDGTYFIIKGQDIGLLYSAMQEAEIFEPNYRIMKQLENAHPDIFKLKETEKKNVVVVKITPKVQMNLFENGELEQEVEEEPISEEEYLNSLPSEEEQWEQDYIERQESGEENWRLDEGGDIKPFDDKRYSLANPELRLYRSISEKFDSDVSELNQFNLRDQLRKGKDLSELNSKDKEYFENSKFSKGYVMHLGNPSSILRKVGVPNLPITVGSNWFLDHIIRNPEHNLRLLNFKGLVEAIQNPIAIILDEKYRGEQGRMEFITTIKSRDNKPVNVVVQLNRSFGNLKVNNVITAMESEGLGRFIKTTNKDRLLYVDKERITDFLEGVQSQVSSLQRHILDGKLVYPKTISDSDTNIQKFLYKVNNFPDILSSEDKRYKQFLSNSLLQDNRESLQEGLNWIRTVLPNADVRLLNGLIDNIARGSYNTVTDLIEASKQFADKGVIKHEAGHFVFNNLPKSEQEKLLNEGSKLFGIPRGESKTTVKYSKVQQNETRLKYEGDLAIEEKIMEQLEKSPDSYHPSTVIGKFFKAIKDFLRDLFKQRDRVQKFIEGVNDGKYKDLQRPENSNKNEQVKYSQLTPQQSEAIDYVWEQNPELTTIGTKEQYSQYLDTIFPDSKVKDIVYHGVTGKDFDKFDRYGGLLGKQSHGIFFTSRKEFVYSNKIKSVILNILNLKINPSRDYVQLIQQAEKDGFDGVYAKGIIPEMRDMIDKKDIPFFEKEDEYVVFKPEQIHILGSKQDIEGFKSFISKKKKQSTIPQDYQSFKQSLFTIDTNPELINKGDELIDENGDRCKL